LFPGIFVYGVRNESIKLLQKRLKKTFLHFNKNNYFVLNQLILIFEIGDQVIADGAVELEVDFARLVDEHLVDADVVHVAGEREEKDSGLDGHVGHDHTEKLTEARKKQFWIQLDSSVTPRHFDCFSKSISDHKKIPVTQLNST
jgi:hypothetical protein